MASTSSHRGDAGEARIKAAASTLCSDSQSLYAEIRKALITMKEVTVDLEKDKNTQLVKELEDGFMQLLEAFVDCERFASAIQSVGSSYRPPEELTDFKKLLDREMAKLKGTSSSRTRSHLLCRQFREAIWNVHNEGKPMPGEEQAEIVMTSTQFSLLNNTCPLSGKPVTELREPVRSMNCKHIYEKAVILQYIGSLDRHKCPVAACPNVLQTERVICDPLLLIEIDEVRSMSRQTARQNVIEDFTEYEEEDSNQ